MKKFGPRLFCFVCFRLRISLREVNTRINEQMMIIDVEMKMSNLNKQEILSVESLLLFGGDFGDYVNKKMQLGQDYFAYTI